MFISGGLTGNRGKEVLMSPAGRFIYYIAIAIILAALFYLYLKWFERSNIYFPTRQMDATPASVGLSYQEVDFTAADGVRLNGWFIPARGSARAAVLICHGNAGNISHRLGIMQMFHWMGLDVFIFDYRGYGKSSGSPSEEGLYLDAEAAYSYLAGEEELGADRIVLYGKSIGGNVAIDLAGEIDADILIANSAFTSTADMAREIYPFLPLGKFITQKFDASFKIALVKCPKLFVYSKTDEIVPYSHGERLFSKALPPKELLTVRGGHNDPLYDDPDFRDGIDSFLKKHGI